MEADIGFSQFIMVNFDIGKADAKTPAGPDGLEERLLCRKAGGIMLKFILLRFAIFNLPPGEYLIAKTCVALHHLLDAGYFDNINSCSVYHTGLQITISFGETNSSFNKSWHLVFLTDLSLYRQQIFKYIVLSVEITISDPIVQK